MVLGLNEMLLPVHLFKFEKSTFQFSLVSTNLKKKSSGFSSVCLQKKSLWYSTAFVLEVGLMFRESS